MNNYIAKNIRYLRILNHLSQQQLADKLNKKSFTTIQKWESASSEPPFSDVIEMSTIFDVDIDDFTFTNLELETLEKENLKNNPIKFNGNSQGIMQRIKNRREQLGLSYQDISEQLGISKSTMQRYETGKIKNMPIDKIEPLAKVLKCTPQYLLGLTNQLLSNKETILLTDFNQLNNVGQDKLIETASDMTFNPKYNKDFLQVVAAHQRTDIEVTDEMIQHDNDIMDDDNF